MPEPDPGTGSGSPLRRLLGSFLGAGRLPGAPGTWGSLATVLVVAAMLGLGDGRGGVLIPGLLPHSPPPSRGLSRGVALGALALVTLLGVLLGNRARADWGRPDPGPFVLDEVAGQLLALLPLLPGPLDPLGAGLAFLLFRLFDVTKPGPIRRLERLPGGVGIMADDLAAGLAAMLPVALFF